MTYLVLARCPLDDIPLRCFTNQHAAIRYARKSPESCLWGDLEKMCRVGGWSHPSAMLYVVIIQFSPRGKPVDSWQEREFGKAS